MKQTMLEHVKTHTSEKNHKCEIYNKFFITKQSMLKRAGATANDIEGRDVCNWRFAEQEHEETLRKFYTDEIEKLFEELNGTFTEVEWLQIDNGSSTEHGRQLQVTRPYRRCGRLSQIDWYFMIEEEGNVKSNE